MSRSLVLAALVILILACGGVLAAPILDRVDTDLKGALVPGSVITFVGEGSPGARATLSIRMTLGSGSPMEWSATMQEDSPGHYLYQWDVWAIGNLTVSSTRIDLKDPNDGSLASKSLAGFPASVGGEIQGAVTDDLSKLPIAGVQLMAYSATTGHYAVAYSNARGEYLLQGLGAAKDYQVWTRNELGYTDAKRDTVQVQNESTTGHVDLILGGLAAITGIVEDEHGTPLLGTMVMALNQDGHSRQETRTDQQGRYCLSGLSSGSYDLIAAYDGVQAKTGIEVQNARMTTTNFRLSLDTEVLASYEVTLPDADESDQLLYWPSGGGPVRSTPILNGQAVLSDVWAGEELTLAVQSGSDPTASYHLTPSKNGQPLLGRIAVDDEAFGGTPQLTFAAPLTTRGGTTLLYGEAVGIEWVDLWIDGLWYARLLVKEQQWQAITNLDTGFHEVMALGVGTDDLTPVVQRVEISRQNPVIEDVRINKQPLSHFYSGGSIGTISAGPKQPLELALTASEVGWSNWLMMGDKQWPMAKVDQKLAVTIPAEAMVAGRYPLTWRWEKQGMRGEMALGTLAVSKPTVYTFVDAITGDPLKEVSVQPEQLIRGQWQPMDDAQTHHSDESGKLSLWLPSDDTFRLWVSAKGYRGETLLVPSGRQDSVVTLDPFHVRGPVYISPERDAREVSPSTPIIVAFDCDLDPRSVTPDRFYIQGASGTITYDPYNRKLILTPSGSLASDANYLVHLSGDIKYIDGSPLGKSLWWLISTGEDNSSADRSTARKLLAANQAGKLATRDGFLTASIPAAASPVQTLYKLERPTSPASLPKGWTPVSPVVGFTAVYSPMDRPLSLLRQGVEIMINYTEPPAEGQPTALWYYNAASRGWEQVEHEHNTYLRTVRFTTTRPGIYLFAKQQTN